MTFDADMHGSDKSFSLDTSGIDMPSFMDMSQATAQKIATLQAKLNQKLGPEYVSQRPGMGGGPKLTYAEVSRELALAGMAYTAYTPYRVGK